MYKYIYEQWKVILDAKMSRRKEIKFFHSRFRFPKNSRKYYTN